MRQSRALAALALLCSGCLQAGEVICADGSRCPANTVCADDGVCLRLDQLAACDGLGDGAPCALTGLGDGVCREGACRIARCGDAVVDPGEPCDDGNRVDGDGCSFDCRSDETCGNGVRDLGEECDCGTTSGARPAGCADVNGTVACRTDCVVPRCGNALLDDGEVCDDGGQASGDGCAFDCRSDETCGNGVLDFFPGETCDDGATRGADGCTASCQREVARWRELDDADGGGYGIAAAYDAARARIVTFGGCCVGGDPRGETREFDGAGWHRVPTADAPTPRIGGVMAFDAARAEVVLFGGQSPTSLRDTWTWDGGRWQRRSPLIAPSARGFQAMAFDPGRREVVLFGGFSGEEQLGDLWAWDGAAWVELTPAGATPQPRDGAAFVADPIRGELVLFGGIGGPGQYLGDTWRWRAGAWHAAAPATSPPAREAPAAGFDPERGRVVVSTGRGAAGYLDDVWEWDGATWTARTTTDRPSPRYVGGSSFDVARGYLMLFGGADDSNLLDDIQSLEANNTWVDRRYLESPPERFLAGLAFDERRGEVVLFGGEHEFGLSKRGDTWVLGDGWSPRTPATSPSPRGGHAMVFDGSRGQVVLFGGDGGTGGATILRGDTWIWNGTTWSALATPTAPSPREDHVMAYDADAQRVVLFGGRTAAGASGDTWVLEAAGWRALNIPGPPARTHSTMAGEARTGDVVLHGGLDFDQALLADTWRLVDDTWVEVVTTPNPGPRETMRLVHDPATGTLVGFGGFVTRGDTPTSDTWRYAAGTWTPLELPTSPIARGLHDMVADPIARRIVVFGGYGPTMLADTWFLEFPQGGDLEACEPGLDLDGDGAVGCDDDDCWAHCAPACPAALAEVAACSADDGPRCGDGACGLVESCRLCPADCGPCVARCGDGACDAPEDAASCPGDCP